MELPHAGPEDTQPKLHALLLKSSATTEADVLAKLVVHPESAQERDDSNSLPLLIAVREQASGPAVEALLALYPEAAKEKNSD